MNNPEWPAGQNKVILEAGYKRLAFRCVRHELKQLFSFILTFLYKQEIIPEKEALTENWFSITMDLLLPILPESYQFNPNLQLKWKAKRTVS